LRLLAAECHRMSRRMRQIMRSRAKPELKPVRDRFLFKLWTTLIAVYVIMVRQQRSNSQLWDAFEHMER
jgi:hypothetical protein